MGRVSSRILEAIMFIYIALVCGWLYINDKSEINNLLSSIILMTISIFFTYGVYSLYRDIKLFGWKWIIKTFKELIWKK